MHAASSNIVRITKHALAGLCFVVHRLAKRLRMPLTCTPGQVMIYIVTPFVMLEVSRLQVRTLLQHYDRESCNRKLLGHDTTGCAGTHDDEVYFFTSRIAGLGSICLRHFYSPLSA